MKRKFKYRRTSEVKITREAILLREYRTRLGLSISEVSKMLNKSESYLRHIEKGRLDLPNETQLSEILRLYDVTLRSFKHKLRLSHDPINIRKEIETHLDLLGDDDLKLVIKFLKSLLSSI